MANPSRGHEKRGTQSECLPVSTAGNLARSKSGTWVDCSKPCLQKSVKGAAPHKEMKRMYGFKRAPLGRNRAAEPLCEIRPMIFLKIEKLSNE